MPNLLSHPPRTPMLFPSILGADFSHMERECRGVLDLGAEGLHVDVMDGHFVPNLTMGPDMVRALRRSFPKVYLDVHLMVQHPERFAEPFAQAGADCLTFHIEATLGRRHHNELEVIELIRKIGCQVGVAVNPPTPAAAIEHLLETVDMALVMSVHPGFSGQKFIPEVLCKTRSLRAAAPATVRIEMDGGINAHHAAEVRNAGCDVIVAASALFGATDRAGILGQLRGA